MTQTSRRIDQLKEVLADQPDVLRMVAEKLLVMDEADKAEGKAILVARLADRVMEGEFVGGHEELDDAERGELQALANPTPTTP